MRSCDAMAVCSWWTCLVPKPHPLPTFPCPHVQIRCPLSQANRGKVCIYPALSRRCNGQCVCILGWVSRHHHRGHPSLLAHPIANFIPQPTRHEASGNRPLISYHCGINVQHRRIHRPLSVLLRQIVCRCVRSCPNILNVIFQRTTATEEGTLSHTPWFCL